MDELRVRELLQEAAEEMIAISTKTTAPIEDVIFNSLAGVNDEPIEIVVLFSEVEHLKNMEERKLKDGFMSAFIKYLTVKEFPFGEQPQIKFQFSISV